MDVRLTLHAKSPGQTLSLSPVDMIFDYKDTFDAPEPEAYETLLLDVLEGNAAQFMRADQVEAAWKVVMPILEEWERCKPSDFPNYNPFSWGPAEASALVGREGHEWKNY